jgi:hypothetical protein
VVHEHEVLDADLLEAHAEGVDPEVIGQLGIANGDVPRHAFVEAELSEQPEPRGKPLFAVEALVLERGEGRASVRLAISRHHHPFDSTDTAC